MRHDDYRDLEAERLRRLRDRDDFGQADYSNMYGYDPRTRTGYRAYEDGRPPESGQWDEPRRARRDGPSDRVLWAVITERLDDQRRLDLRDVEVIVRDGEVTLTGTVEARMVKRAAEECCDHVRGVTDVHNHLRVKRSETTAPR